MFSKMRILLRTSTIGVATGTMAMATTFCVSGAHVAAVRRASSSTSDNSPALLSQRSFFSGGADGRSSASIVVVDAELAAKERDRIAREMLSQNMPSPHAEERLVVTMRGLEHTVPYTLRIVLNGPNEAKNGEVIAGKVLKEAFEVVDQHLNHYNPESEVSAINQLPLGAKHTMSQHMRRVMECCVRVYASSGACFDPATGPLVEFLRSVMKDEKSDTESTLTEEEVERFCLPQSFDVNMTDGTIARKHEGAKLDLGGVNKGYTVDRVVEKLNAAGMRDVMFEWGGDCRATGVNYQHQPWAIAIVRPPPVEVVEQRAKEGLDEKNEASQLLRLMYLDDEALCTSGDYENVMYSPKYGVRSNIFDWKKRSLLEPVESELAQVSIKCYSAMYADALATASLIKREISKVRHMLEEWRHSRNRVTNYVTYTRQGERVARMFEIATENAEIRKNRIAGSLPARVIVVGGGLAGLSAAIEATACGAQVILLEKEPRVGGNSAKATSGINGWGTRAQALDDIQDNSNIFERDTHKSGLGGSTVPSLVRTLSVKSGDAISWLSSLGVPLTVLSQLGGHSRKRTHRAPDKADGTPVPIGFTIMQTLEQHVRTKLADRVTIMENTTVTSLLSKSRVRHDGAKQVRVYGVEVLQDEGVASRILADAVILATGGFSNDKTPNSLLQEFAPQLSGFPTTNGPWATGDGVKLARELGVKLVDMDKVQLHPTGLIDPKDPANPTKYLGPEALRGSGGVLLNKKGERFVNELDLRSVVSNAIIEQGDEYPDSGGSKFAFCVLNDAAVRLFGVNSHGFYWNRLGLFVKADTVEKLAALIGCPVENVRNTLGDYEQLSKENRQCPKTRKIVYPCVVGPQGPFYVAFVTPSIHYTMGGCLISPSAEMQLEENTTSPFGHRRPIFGLFGAGEVTGGVHGGNRLGGNSLLECVVFGRIAGDRAATILQKKPVPLSFKTWTTVILREVREGGMYGTGSRVLRFNLPGALQRSGLQLGQFIAIRGEWDGQQLIGYYSPITLPDDLGVIGILARSDKGTLKEWISALEPGDAVEMKGCGGLVIERRFSERYLYFSGHALKKLCLIAGGTGVAPMLQIIRAALKKPFLENIESICLIYAAEDVSELTYRELLEQHQRDSKGKFRSIFVLNRPPPVWTDGVGFIDKKLLSSSVQPPAKDLLVAICGPPIMQRVVKTCLKSLGYDMQLVRTVDEVETQNSSKM